MWNVELDNGDNIDTSTLILNENEDGGLAGLGRGYPCLPPGKLMYGGNTKIPRIVIKFCEERILIRWSTRLIFA